MADKKIYPREEMFLQDDTGRPTMNGLAQHRVLSGEVEKEQEVVVKVVLFRLYKMSYHQYHYQLNDLSL